MCIFYTLWLRLTYGFPSGIFESNRETIASNLCPYTVVLLASFSAEDKNQK